MIWDWLLGMRKHLAAACAVLFVTAGVSQAGDNEAELRALLEQQQRQIQELKKQMEASAIRPVAGEAADGAKPPMVIEEDSIKKIVASYLQENPGAGMPPSVQTGFFPGQGFVIRSTNDPKYVKWEDECKIPFELRIKGRVQLDYYNYRVTDSINHQTNRPSLPAAGGNIVRPADFSQEEVKRTRLIFEGTVFDPNLRYHIELDGNTRGLGGTQNNKVVQTAPTGGFNPAGAAVSPIGGGVTVDHAVRLFSAYVAYDWHPCASEKGCGPDCPDGTYQYAPTISGIVGKIKPFFGFEEFCCGSGNEQFVEYSMADWFFDADDDNLLMGAGVQVRAVEDRFFLQALVTNGSESQFPNTQMDDYPGFNLGLWYDFGGNWNADKKRWDLYGNYLGDLEYSCKPVFRVGAAANIVPLDRRSLYGDPEQSRFFVMAPGVGGTRLINELNGDAVAPNGSHAVDKFDAYSYDAFVGGKWKGFSLSNEWWLRDLNNFHSTPNGKDLIVYQDTMGANGGTRNALFPHHAILDYGMQLQGGYFIIPKKLEVVARWSWIRGESGDINGNGQRTTTVVPGVGTVDLVKGAFREFHEANEYTVGFNYFFKGNNLKWSSDFSVYEGGNPAGGGVSPAGFIAGQDGWLLRTQIQLAF